MLLDWLSGRNPSSALSKHTYTLLIPSHLFKDKTFFSCCIHFQFLGMSHIDVTLLAVPQVLRYSFHSLTHGYCTANSALVWRFTSREFLTHFLQGLPSHHPPPPSLPHLCRLPAHNPARVPTEVGPPLGVPGSLSQVVFPNRFPEGTPDIRSGDGQERQPHTRIIPLISTFSQNILHILSKLKHAFTRAQRA